ncbi:MAG: hypothetical protein AABX53_00470 [Nanoarchaeota archaeon]
MKNNCIICGVEIEKQEGDLCETCFGFFQDKYKKGLKKEVARFKQSNKFLKKWRSQSAEKEVEE